MNQKSLKSKSITGFFWDFGGNLSNQFFSFVTSVVLARLLGPNEFGLIALINVLFIFSNLLMDVGLGAALIHRRRSLPIHYSSVFYFNVFIGFIITILVYFSAPFFSQYYNQPLLEPLVKATSFIFLINSTTLIQNIKLRKTLNFKSKSIIRIIANSTSGITGIILAYNGFGVWSLLVQQFLNKLLFAIIIWITVGWIPLFAFSFKALKQLWSFGINIFFTNMLTTATGKIDAIIIGKIFSVSTLGFYQRAQSLHTLISQFSSRSLMEVMFPLLSNFQYDNDKMKAVFNKSFSLLSLLVFYITGLFFLCADEFIPLVYTAKWNASIVYFKILILSSFGVSFSPLLVNTIVAKGKSRVHLVLTFIKQLPLLLNLFVGFLFGINGFLIGLLISTCINFFINLWFVKRELQTNWNFFLKPFFPPIILAFGGVLIVEVLLQMLAFEHLVLLFFSKALLFSFIYFISAFLLKLQSFIIFKDIAIQLIKRKLN